MMFIPHAPWKGRSKGWSKSGVRHNRRDPLSSSGYHSSWDLGPMHVRRSYRSQGGYRPGRRVAGVPGSSSGVWVPEGYPVRQPCSESIMTPVRRAGR